MSTITGLYQLLEKTCRDLCHYVITNHVRDIVTRARFHDIIDNCIIVTISERYLDYETIIDHLLPEVGTERNIIIRKGILNYILPPLPSNNIVRELLLPDLATWLTYLDNDITVSFEAESRSDIDMLKKVFSCEIYYNLDPTLDRYFQLEPERRSIYMPDTILQSTNHGDIDIPLLYEPTIRFGLPQDYQNLAKVKYVEEILKRIDLYTIFREEAEKQGLIDREIEQAYSYMLHILLKYPKTLDHIRRIILLLAQIDRQHIEYYPYLPDKDITLTQLGITQTVTLAITPPRIYNILNNLKQVTYKILQYRP